MAKTYKALADGYDGQRLIRAGETFASDIKPGKWMEEVAAAKPSPKPATKSND